MKIIKSDIQLPTLFLCLSQQKLTKPFYNISMVFCIQFNAKRDMAFAPRPKTSAVSWVVTAVRRAAAMLVPGAMLAAAARTARWAATTSPVAPLTHAAARVVDAAPRTRTAGSRPKARKAAAPLAEFAPKASSLLEKLDHRSSWISMLTTIYNKHNPLCTPESQVVKVFLCDQWLKRKYKTRCDRAYLNKDERRC